MTIWHDLLFPQPTEESPPRYMWEMSNLFGCHHCSRGNIFLAFISKDDSEPHTNKSECQVWYINLLLYSKHILLLKSWIFPDTYNFQFKYLKRTYKYFSFSVSLCYLIWNYWFLLEIFLPNTNMNMKTLWTVASRILKWPLRFLTSLSKCTHSIISRTISLIDFTSMIRLC